jgi:hypothetical protein
VTLFQFSKDILPLLLQTNNHTTTKTATNTTPSSTVPFCLYRPYPTVQPMMSPSIAKRWRGGNLRNRTNGSPTAFSEINGTIIVEHKSTGTQYLYGIANDAFGCYQWNVDTCQIVTTYTIPTLMNHSHSTLYAMEYIKDSNELLLGGEDGQLSIWDTNANALLDVVNVNTMIVEDVGLNQKSTFRTHANINNNSVGIDQTSRDHRPSSIITAGSTSSIHGMTPKLYISSCTVWKEQWWIIAGGFHRSTNDSSSIPHGYIAIIHGVARSILSYITTPYKVQHVSIYTRHEPDNTNDDDDNTTSNQSYTSQQLVVLTNTNYTYHWTNPLELLDTTSLKVSCHTPSAYSVATMEYQSTSIVAIAGVGTIVDLYKDGVQHCGQLFV